MRTLTEMYCVGWVVCLLVVFLHTFQNVESTVFDAEFEKKLDSFVQATMDCRHVPGLTLAVTKDNETWTKGYGLADISTSRSVANNTRFNIGSVTKSFTMALLGLLLTENNMTWTTKVRDIMGPGYVFVDEYRTKEMMLKDLLSHRTGLARLDVGTLAGYPGTTRENLIKNMRYLPEAKPFRDAFIYNNYMFAYLGHICEVLGGDTWENLLQDRLLTPLGMTSTKILKTEADVQTGNVAKPYIYKDGRFQNGTLNMYPLSPLEPAGAILSTGADMIKWMQFLLNKGSLSNGTKLVDEKLMEVAMNATTVINDDNYLETQLMTFPQWPADMTPVGYGHALFVNTYRGYQLVWHGGSLMSYISRMFTFPDMNTGVFVSTNGPGYKSLADLTTATVSFFATDGVFGLDPWLNDTTTCTYPEPWVQKDDMATPTTLDATTTPSITDNTNNKSTDRIVTNPDDYIGSFQHYFLPNLEVLINLDDNTTLRFQTGRLSGVLHSTNKTDTFKMEIVQPWELKVAYTDKNNQSVTSDVTFSWDEGQVVNVTTSYDVKVTYFKALPRLARPEVETSTKAANGFEYRTLSVLTLSLLLLLVVITYSY